MGSWLLGGWEHGWPGGFVERSPSSLQANGQPCEGKSLSPAFTFQKIAMRIWVILLIFFMLHRAKSGNGDFTHSKAAAYRLPA